MLELNRLTKGRIPHARGDEPHWRFAQAMGENVYPTHVGMNR